MYQLQVGEMSCGHCVASITRAVQTIDAAAQVSVDLVQRQVDVLSQASLNEIAAAIEAAGYPVIGKTTT